MKVGILGSGKVGRTLASGFLTYGHEVMIGSRMPHSEKIQIWLEENGEKASSGSFKKSATFGDIVVLALAWNGGEHALKLAGSASFKGKPVLDVMNPFIFEEGKPKGLSIGLTDSAGEQVQRWLPEAHIVKVFNTVGYTHMVDPDFPGGPPDMFICGNNENAKDTAAGICRQFGWSVVDMGGIEGSRELESLSLLWLKYAVRSESRNHVFKLLRK